MNIQADATTGALKISGSIHTNGVRRLRDALLAHLAEAPGEAVVDMTGVDMCDTSSLQVLAALRRSAASQSRACRIEVSPEIRETMQMLGFPSTILGGQEAASHGL